VAQSDVPVALKLLSDRGATAWEVGRIERGEGEASVAIDP